MCVHPGNNNNNNGDDDSNNKSKGTYLKQWNFSLSDSGRLKLDRFQENTWYA